jgi:hypothetical protein
LWDDVGSVKKMFLLVASKIRLAGEKLRRVEKGLEEGLYAFVSASKQTTLIGGFFVPFFHREP